MTEGRITDIEQLFNIFRESDEPENFVFACEEFEKNEELTLDMRYEVFNGLISKFRKYGSSNMALAITSEMKQTLETVESVIEIAFKLKEQLKLKEDQVHLAAEKYHEMGRLGLIYRNYKYAEEHLILALSTLKLSNEDYDKKLFARISGNLANVYQIQGFYEKSIEIYLSQLNVFDQTNHPKMTLFAYINSATAYYEMGDLESQYILLKQALNILDNQPEIDETNIALALHYEFAKYYIAKGEFKQGIEHLVNGIQSNKTEISHILPLLSELCILVLTIGEKDLAMNYLGQMKKIIPDELHADSFNLKIAEIALLVNEKSDQSLIEAEKILTHLMNNPPSEYHNYIRLILYLIEIEIIKNQHNLQNSKPIEVVFDYVENLINKSFEHHSFYFLVRLLVFKARLLVFDAQAKQAFQTLVDAQKMLEDKNYHYLDEILIQEKDRISTIFTRLLEEVEGSVFDERKEESITEVYDYLNIIKSLF